MGCNARVEAWYLQLCIGCHDLITNRIRENRYANKIIVLKPYAITNKELCNVKLEEIEITHYSNHII